MPGTGGHRGSFQVGQGASGPKAKRADEALGLVGVIPGFRYP